jgi:hypothetical protein
MLVIYDVTRVARFVPVVEEVTKSKRLTEEDLYWNRLDDYLNPPKKKSSYGGSTSYPIFLGEGSFIMMNN